MLQVNQQTVRNWIDRRELPTVRVGARRVRVRRTDLDAYLAGRGMLTTGEEQRVRLGHDRSCGVPVTGFMRRRSGRAPHQQASRRYRRPLLRPAATGGTQRRTSGAGRLSRGKQRERSEPAW
ncbi:MAG: helix-turn-helix domain-containing protein [Solirubrobacteraceae bacterium]